MANYGVTPEGFIRKRVENIREELRSDFKGAFGDDIDVSEQSNFGAIIDILTKKFATLWEGLEFVYNSRDVNGATGVSLDRLCQMVGVTRRGSTSSTVQCLLIGADTTLISANKLVSQSTTNMQFRLFSDVTLSVDDTVKTFLEIANVVDSTPYTITLDLHNYSVNSGAGATKESIVALLKAEIDSTSTDYIFIDNLDGTFNITSLNGYDTYSISVSANIDIKQVSNIGQFYAVETGSNIVPADTVDTIDTPVSGWDGVINLQAGVTGRDQESDDELRARRSLSLFSSGAGTDEAIRSNLLNEIFGVTTVRVFSNRTNSTVDSRPAKSYEVLISGGNDDDIANKLWEIQPSGIESYGNTTIVVKDSNGDNQTLKFSRPVSKYLWIKYTLDIYSEEELTANIESVIKKSVIEFGSEEYQSGVDVIRDRLFKPVYDSTNGVGNIIIETAITSNEGDTPSYGTSNISIADRELAVPSYDRITVLIP